MRNSSTPPPEGSQTVTLGEGEPPFSVLVKHLRYDEDSAWDFSSYQEQLDDIFGDTYVSRFLASGGSFKMQYHRNLTAHTVTLKIWARHTSQRWLTVFGLL